MSWVNNKDRPHPAFAEPFRAYANYLEVIAGHIQRSFGHGAALLDGVHGTVLAHPPVHRVQRRPLEPGAAADLESGLRKGWGFLRRVQREVADEDLFDEEVNALLPYSTWYAEHHVGRAFAAAARQTVPRDHLALLHALGRTVVTRGLLPLPWAGWCEGCPQTGSQVFGGLANVGAIHVLSRPTSDTFEDRLALVLRTTRARDLDRSFDGLRQRKAAPGRTRRNLTQAEKERHAQTFAPTTLFDFLYRLRLAASYGEADVFVLGSRNESDARQLARLARDHLRRHRRGTRSAHRRLRRTRGARRRRPALQRADRRLAGPSPPGCMAAPCRPTARSTGALSDQRRRDPVLTARATNVGRWPPPRPRIEPDSTSSSSRSTLRRPGLKADTVVGHFLPDLRALLHCNDHRERWPLMRQRPAARVEISRSTTALPARALLHEGVDERR